MKYEDISRPARAHDVYYKLAINDILLADCSGRLILISPWLNEYFHIIPRVQLQISPLNFKHVLYVVLIHCTHG